MKKKINGYEARSDKVVKFVVMLMLIGASLMPLSVSADTRKSTNATAASTPTPAPTVPSPRSVSPSEQQSTEPSVSWNS